MTKHWKDKGPGPNVYHGRIQTLVMNGGTHVQDNRHRISHHHDNSQITNIRNEKNVFNDQVFGYIREVNNAKGPIAAYRHETNVLHQDDLDSVPRSLRAPKRSTPSPSPAINQDKHAHYNPPQGGHYTTCNRVPPSRTRDAAGGKRTEPVGRLMLTGGEKHSSPTSRHGLPSINAKVEAELSQMSPEMQEFVAKLQSDTVKNARTVRSPKRSASGKPVAAQRQRLNTPHWPPGGSHCPFDDEAFTEEQPSSDEGDDR